MKHFIHYALFLFLLTGALSACSPQEEEMPASPMESEEILHEGMPHESMDSAPTTPEESAAELETFQSANKYQSPGGTDDMKATLSLDKQGVIQSVSVSTEAANDGSRYYLENFNKNLPAALVGKKLADVKALSTLGGASLSTKAFNIALADIQNQAK